MKSMAFPSPDKFAVTKYAWKLILVLLLSIYLILASLPTHYYPSSNLFSPSTPSPPPTNLSHLMFGILGSEKAWHRRKNYIESWWRPNTTRGLVYLDKAPTGDLLSWLEASPPYRVSENLDKFLKETKANSTKMIRLVHGIKELMREVERVGEVRWVVMGDDDSIFMVDNMVGVLAELDHSQYYYVGAPSDFIMSNYWFSFNQGFGGAAYMMSYPLARALAHDIDNCLRRHGSLLTADVIAMN